MQRPASKTRTICPEDRMTSAVPSVQPLHATMTSSCPGSKPVNRASRQRKMTAASLCAGITTDPSNAGAVTDPPQPDFAWGQPQHLCPPKGNAGRQQSVASSTAAERRAARSYDRRRRTVTVREGQPPPDRNRADGIASPCTGVGLLPLARPGRRTAPNPLRGAGPAPRAGIRFGTLQRVRGHSSLLPPNRGRTARPSRRRRDHKTPRPASPRPSPSRRDGGERNLSHFVRSH